MNTAANMDLLSSGFSEGKPMLRIIALQLWQLGVRLREEHKLCSEVLSINDLIGAGEDCIGLSCRSSTLHITLSGLLHTKLWDG
jgi:hypothetical protein